MDYKLIIEPEFEKALVRLGSSDSRSAMKKIQFLFALFEKDRNAFRQYLYRPYIPMLPHGLTSTLYMLKLTQKIRAFATFDDDPLFEISYLKLHRLLVPDDFNRAFLNAAREIYSKIGLNLEGGENDSA